MERPSRTTTAFGSVAAVAVLLTGIQQTVGFGDLLPRIVPDEAIVSHAELSAELTPFEQRCAERAERITRLEQRLDSHIEHANANVRWRREWRDKVESKLGTED